jgi:site-specific DNA recombinase
MASFAEFEQEMTRERLAEARAALKRRGRRVAGAVPYGYKRDPATKQLVPDRREARRVLAIFERAARGETPRQIAHHANRYGWRTKRTTSRKTGQTRGGNRWTPRQVLATLANPTYLGLIRAGMETRPGIHRPLVTQELFDQANSQVSRRRGRARPRSPRAVTFWPLGGVLICGTCGRAMSPSVSGYRNLDYRYYRCRSHAGGRPPCAGVSVPAEEIERFVCQLLGNATAEDLEGLPNRQAFCEAWSGLGDRPQRRLLPKILSRIEFNVPQGELRVHLQPGACEILNEAI